MYRRIFKPPQEQSYFLLGPRGTGKSRLVEQIYRDGLYFDLLESGMYNELLASPVRLADKIPVTALPHPAYQPCLASPVRLADKIPAGYEGWVVIDEIQKVPALLDEVHRLIEKRGLRFVLTGSSARALRRKGTNLLAGRALTCRMHPLTVEELGGDFDLRRSLQYGHLPRVQQLKKPGDFIRSYVGTYLKEEIQQEGLTRSLPAFSRFLEAASFCQASVLNVSSVASECAVNRKTVESYFSILRDTLLSRELAVFARRAKRKLVSRVKFYFFDVGVFRALRPRGPLDTDQEIGGVALETLVMQEIVAQNDYKRWGYDVCYWRTRQGVEVDFVLYGGRGLKAIEVKSTGRLRREDFKGLLQFKKDHPEADAMLLYAGTKREYEKDVAVVPVETFLRTPAEFI